MTIEICDKCRGNGFVSLGDGIRGIARCEYCHGTGNVGGEVVSATYYESDSSMTRVGFKRLTDNAVIPTKAHASDSGLDLVASEDVGIWPGMTKVIPTGISIQLPEGYEAVVRPRSGITSRTKLRVQTGTIDNGFTGEIGIIADNIFAEGRHESYYRAEQAVDNSSPSLDVFGRYYIRRGDRIAQLVVQALPNVVTYEIDGDMGETKRGSGGFGSTGVSEEDGR